MRPSTRILLVEDDGRLAGMLDELLEGEGYSVTIARDGQRALHEGLTSSFDLLLLDRGLPVIEGLDVLEKLRAAGVDTPALILSALGNPADRVEGLDRGAEDYLSKPFDIAELLARLRALRRRQEPNVSSLRIPGGRLDARSRLVTLDNAGYVLLSERENDLLAKLAGRPNQVFERAALLDDVFPEADDLGVVDTYVHYLRKKLGRSVVLTVRGIGYRIGIVS